MRHALVKAMVLVVALGVVAAGCSKSGSEGSSGGGTMTIGSDTANDHGTKDVSGKDEFELELDNFYFSPTVLKGTAGQQLKLELTNEASTLHNFTVQDQDVEQDVKPGEKEEVTVTFPQSGILEFFCEYHKSKGMVGELSV